MADSPVTREWRRAGDCLQAATLCLEHGLYADAISRAYYSIMHTAKATLVHLGVRVSNHRGVKNRFGQQLVIPGLVEPEFAADISQSFEDRLRADYDITVDFFAVDAEEACGRAQAFRERMKVFLGNAGLTGDAEAAH